ncbi:uncharacterized protein LOC17899856 isoform X5 [Capsella rubella]|uniref:uncharacterized protein LOC17899856 isoform X5 n=1 Tax=Capsella rubella TaxID=81985 RepID=UPI000CD4B6F5|nr:uncharacterized protein LOC17899856 isoform X5 [Capsella rubella]
MKGSNSKGKPFCRMSDVTKPHKLCQRMDPPLTVCISCKGQPYVGNRRGYYYYCATCGVEFHDGCHLFPPEIKHPFHLHHSLTLTFLDHDLDSSALPEIWFGLTIDSYNDAVVKEKNSHSSTDSSGGEEEDSASDDDDSASGEEDSASGEEDSASGEEDCGSGEVVCASEEEDSASDGNHKKCKSCRKSITYNSNINFYSCAECDFVLHGTCACLPRIKHHPLHKHPLSLYHLHYPHLKELQSKYYDLGFFVCNGCSQKCCGFMYKCCEKGCVFQLDARCASLPDPIIHDCHPHDHPLFFNLTEGKCMVCKITSGLRKSLECIECRSFLCLTCATLPLVAHYKYDKHPLTLCCGEEKTTDLQYWCEVCESEIDAKKWFYTCNSCSVTLHVTCLLGDNIYMKLNHVIKMYEGAETSIDIVPNSGNSRPMCDGCRRRCVDTMVVKSTGKNYCTIMCFFDIYYPW